MPFNKAEQSVKINIFYHARVSNTDQRARISMCDCTDTIMNNKQNETQFYRLLGRLILA